MVDLNKLVEEFDRLQREQRDVVGKLVERIMYLEQENLPKPNLPYCVVCGENPVDTSKGYDTCPRCLLHRV